MANIQRYLQVHIPFILYFHYKGTIKQNNPEQVKKLTQGYIIQSTNLTISYHSRYAWLH